MRDADELSLLTKLFKDIPCGEKKKQINLSNLGFYFILKILPQYHWTVFLKGPEI